MRQRIANLLRTQRIEHVVAWVAITLGECPHGCQAIGVIAPCPHLRSYKQARWRWA